MLFTMGIILGVVSLHHVLFENPEFNKSCRDINKNNEWENKMKDIELIILGILMLILGTITNI